MHRWSVIGITLAACASAGDPLVHDGPSRGDDSSGSGSDGSGGTGVHECPAGQLATAVGAGRDLTCAPIEPPTQTALDDRCSIYLGQRDSCDGCTLAPTKWGRAGGKTCLNGLGADASCTMPTLGGVVVQPFGLNLDGDVDGNDKIYGGLHCASLAPTDTAAPCKPGEFISGYNGTSWTCRPLASAVTDYVRTSCSLYMGWQDNCDGCVDPPVKWGFAGDRGCTNGAGDNDTCTTATLGGEPVILFGLNTDGNVNGDDKLHLGLQCATAAPAGMNTAGACPPGQFVSKTGASDARCDSPAPTIAQYVSAHCSVYFGWSDGCNGCTSPPSKWGKVSVGACMNGQGADSTCSQFNLGGQSVFMFGLNTDGDVDENDTLYISLTCR